MSNVTAFVSGHLDITKEEFEENYVPQLAKAVANGFEFVVGDAPGCDFMAQTYLAQRGAKFDVYHMFERPRLAVPGYSRLVGGFTSDNERDAAMTDNSTIDIAWVRPGKRKNNGTAKNIKRREAQRVTVPATLSETAYCRWHARVDGTSASVSKLRLPIDLAKRFVEASKRFDDAASELDLVSEEVDRLLRIGNC